MKNSVNGPYYSQARAEMLAYLPERASRVLEVGCGVGNFGALLREKYPLARLHAVEQNENAAAEAANLYDVVWVRDVGESLEDSEGNSFDLIVFNDVLEHLVDPWKCLVLARARLAPTGMVVASIPNMRFWPILSDLVFQGAWTYRDAGVMDRTHLRFFTKHSIRSLFEQCGYRVDQIEGINETWKKSMRWRVLNILFAGALRDCLYPQFAVTATPIAQPDESDDITKTPK